VVAVSVLAVYIDACIWSIAQWDSRTVEQTVQTFDVSVHVVSIFSVEITVLFENVLDDGTVSDTQCLYTLSSSRRRNNHMQKKNQK